jgi:hypothetical protein
LNPVLFCERRRRRLSARARRGCGAAQEYIPDERAPPPPKRGRKPRAPSHGRGGGGGGGAGAGGGAGGGEGAEAAAATIADDCVIEMWQTQLTGARALACASGGS